MRNLDVSRQQAFFRQQFGIEMIEARIRRRCFDGGEFVCPQGACQFKQALAPRLSVIEAYVPLGSPRVVLLERDTNDRPNTN
ncbi:hypothetical protein BC361_21140 [Ensifer sp. LC54]|nr:hypothetical protein BC363_24660 [Ensifer sp. LC384]OCP24307.1 hypothetical protein BC361_21140 [Ensifer sp. LC54]